MIVKLSPTAPTMHHSARNGPSHYLQNVKALTPALPTGCQSSIEGYSARRPICRDAREWVGWGGFLGGRQSSLRVRLIVRHSQSKLYMKMNWRIKQLKLLHSKMLQAVLKTLSKPCPSIHLGDSDTND